MNAVFAPTAVIHPLTVSAMKFRFAEEHKCFFVMTKLGTLKRVEGVLPFRPKFIIRVKIDTGSTYNGCKTVFLSRAVISNGV